MKHCIAVLLVCLLIAGTVSAISMSPGSAGVAKVSATPTTHILVNSSAGYKVSAVATEVMNGMLEIYSVPSGAAVTLDGYSTPGEKTPMKYSLPAGSHTVVLSLSDYQDYTTTFNLDAGTIKDINADLKRKISASLVQSAALQVSGVPTPVTIVTLPATGRSTPEPASQTGPVRTIEHVPVTLTFVSTTTPIPWACPNTDWSCLTPAEAEQQFGYPNARYGDRACRYVSETTQNVAKYCYQDVPSSGTLSPEVLHATGIKEGDDIYVINSTWIEHAVVNNSLAQPKSVITNPSPLQPLFDFFSGILSGSKKPESRLTIVGFNPCPEPPGQPEPMSVR